MGWTETCAVEERMRFVVMVQKHEESFAVRGEPSDRIQVAGAF